MGDPAHPVATRETLGAVRARELHEAGAVLGLASVTLRDWGDGKLAERDPREVEEDILAWLEERRPDVLITWGPDGAYGHPDHIAAGERCLAALARAPHLLPARVYRFVLHAVWADALRRYVPEWAGMLDTLVGWREGDLGALVTLTDEELEVKWSAMQRHRSQAPDLEKYARIYPVDTRVFRYEAYLRHHPPHDGRLERELF